MEKSENKFMVRYGRDNNNNRNSVLLTFREGDNVFFGVSRCCNKDRFNRERGLEIARGRAFKAKDVFVANEPLALGRDTHYGFVPVTAVPDLLDWFRSLNK